MKTIIIYLIFICMGVNGMAQNMCLTNPFKMEEANLILYEKNTRIYLAPVQEDSVNMDNPEDFISSYLTASNQEWMNRHFVSEKSRIKLSDKKISERKNFDEHLDFTTLIHKLSFEFQGKEHIIIKVLPYKKGRKRGYRAYHIYKDTNNKWVINNTLSNFYNIQIFVKKIKSTIVLKLLRKSNYEDNPILQEAINQSFSSNNIFDVDLFIQLTNSWLANQQMDKYHYFYDK